VHKLLVLNLEETLLSANSVVVTNAIAIVSGLTMSSVEAQNHLCKTAIIEDGGKIIATHKLNVFS
jgi:hypothetical protein